MNKNTIGNLDFSQIIRRKLAFHLDNDIFPKEGNEDHDRGEQDALESMLIDSTSLTEQQFETKYLAEMKNLLARLEAKPYSAEDGDDYYESYNNTVVEVMALINPLHAYDLTDTDQT